MYYLAKVYIDTIMKILLSQKIAMLSGSEWHILHLAEGLMSAGHTVHFLALVDHRSVEPADELIDMFVSRKVQVHRLLVRSDYSLALYRSIDEILKREQYDIIHSHLIRTDFILSMVKWRYGCSAPLISSQHTFGESYQMKYGFKYVPQPFSKYVWVSRLTQRFIDGNISMSKAIKDMYVQHKIYSEDKVEVIYHGFDFSHVVYDPDTSKYRKAPKQLLIVGRLIGVKGHAYVIDILPELIEKYEDEIALVIVGSGVDEQHLKSLARSKGVDQQVYFEGFSTRVHDYIANSDIVLIPSFAEGFCVVLMEAYYSKAALVTFDVPALNENIFHNKTGMLAPAFDTQVFKQNIIDILDDPQLAQRLIENGREYLDNYLSIERMSNETIAYYEKILSQKQATKK